MGGVSLYASFRGEGSFKTDQLLRRAGWSTPRLCWAPKPPKVVMTCTAMCWFQRFARATSPVAGRPFAGTLRWPRGARAYTAKAESFGFCQELVQRSDVESFLCLPFVPAAARPGILAGESIVGNCQSSCQHAGDAICSSAQSRL